MSLLKELVKETVAAGATSAHSIGGHGGHETMADLKGKKRGSSLFKGGLVRRAQPKLSNASRMKEGDLKPIKQINTWNWRIIGEMVDETRFDASDVMSKLDAAEKKARSEEDTVPFGLEDEEGNIIKVYVKAEEADEFESALAAMLAGEDEDEDDQNTGMEIAEVLFKLKDKFQIVDVQWPDIEGDVDEEQEVAGVEGDLEADVEAELGAEGEPGVEGEVRAKGEMGPEGVEGDLEAEVDIEGEDLEMEPEGGAESALQAVIDLMKADAEAKKAEAEAREAEAKAREAEANASSAASKVKQEEQVLDMEAWEKDKKSQEDEVNKLARLAQMQHRKAQDAEVDLAQEEEEARVIGQPWKDNASDPRTPITKDELLALILHHLKGQK